MSRRVIKASAGTGKTYQLSLFYLLSLYQGVPFPEIFVMTFTRKATAEIRERILAFAKSILAGGEEGEELKKNLQKLAPEEVLEDAVLEKAYHAMIQNKEKIRIYTIDSFFQMIFHKIVCPYRQAYTMKMQEEGEEEAFFQKLLKHMFSHKESFHKLRDFFEMTPEKNVDNYVEMLKSMLNERWKFLLLEEEMPAKEELAYDRSIGDYLEELDANFQEAAEIKKKPSHQYHSEAFKEILLLEPEEREAFFLKDLEEALKFNFRNGRSFKSNIKDAQEQFCRYEELLKGLQKELVKHLYNEEMLPYERELLQILGEVYELYDNMKWQDKAFSYQDVSLYSYMLLMQEDLDFVKEGCITEALEESLDCRFHSIFLDEFQDTSVLQWKLLSCFLEKAEEVICVGDEKQSIYAWRGGEKKLFEALPEIFGVEADHLSTSYRSLASIVEGTNAIFKDYAKTRETGLSWDFLPSLAAKEERGRLSLHKEEEEEEGMRNLAAFLREHYEGKYGAVGILVRRNKTLQALAEIFEEEKIPYQISKTAKHEEEEVISSFLPMFRYFVDGKYLHFLEFFRSKFLHLSNATLKKLLNQEENVVQYMQGMLSDLGELPEECKYIRELYRSYQEDEGAISDLWLEAMELFSLTDYVKKEAQYLAWYRFQEILSRYTTWEEYFSALDAGEIVEEEAWEEESQNALQMMTIHKSKGLEFETVIYFDVAKKRAGQDRRRLLFYCEYSKDYRSLVSSFFVKRDYKKYLELLDAPFSKYVKEEEEKNLEEEINNLYVAFTRPKYNLHLFVDRKFPGLGCIEAAFETVEQGQEYYKEKEEEPEEAKEEVVISLDFHKERLEYRKDEKLRPQKYTEQTEFRRMEGIATHFFLEQIRYAKPEEIAYARKRVFQEYANYFGPDEMEKLFSEERIHAMLTKDPEIFSEDWDEVAREYPILDRTTQKKYVIDRFMVKKAKRGQKGRILIVDYKTGGSDPAQLAKYAALVEEALEYQRDEYEIETKFLVLGRKGE